MPMEMVKKYKIPENEYVDKHLIPQLKELVNTYKPSLIFSDGGEWDSSEDSLKTKQFLAWLYNESSVKKEVVVNDRFAKGMPGHHGDYYSSEYSDAKFAKHHPWEESRGIGGSYGFNRAENLENYSTSKQLITELIDIVSRGGNLLLNIGPAADGTIPVIMQERLSDIGEWLKVNGEAIYKSRQNKIPSEEVQGHKVYYTKKGNNTYALFTQWTNKPLKISIDRKVSKVSMLGIDKEVKWKMDKGGLLVQLPDCTINELPSTISWVLKIE